MKKVSLVLLAFVLVIMAKDFKNLDYSQTPPGGLDVKNVPLFVVIGADDCGNAGALDWLTSIFKDMNNPKGTGNKATFDGAKSHFSFYVNGKYIKDAGEAWKRAYDSGNEIGNHTFSHFLDSNDENIDARLLDGDAWYNEIVKNDSIIKLAVGVGKDEGVGFRTPRLEFNRDGFLSMVKRGFVYDCSIEEGGEDGQDGTNFFWPYTLHNGSMADSIQASQSVGDDDWGYKKVGKIDKLWEFPVYNFTVPHDSLSKKYSFKKGLRARIANNFDYFDTTLGSLTGFDYNIFAPAEWDGAQMSGAEYLATLKNSFDLRRVGNRAPFHIGMHPDFYTEETDEDYKSAGNYKERRAHLEEMIKYMASFPEVRFVRMIDVINWMNSPVGLDGTKGE